MSPRWTQMRGGHQHLAAVERYLAAGQHRLDYGERHRLAAAQREALTV